MTSSAVRPSPFTKERSENRMLLCVNSTAFWRPVVPDVDRMHATSSDDAAARSRTGSNEAQMPLRHGAPSGAGACLSMNAMDVSVGMRSFTA